MPDHSTPLVTFPTIYALPDTITRLQKISITALETSFFDVLIKLINEHYGSSFKLPDGRVLQTCLKDIWDNELNPISAPFIIDFLAQTDSLSDFISILVAARCQAVVFQKKIDLANNPLQYFQETQQRYHFMIYMADELEALLYFKNITKEREKFLSGIINDTTGNIRYIGNALNGLFTNHIIRNHTQLSSYGIHSIRTTHHFVKKMMPLFETYYLKENAATLCAIWMDLASFSLDCAKYYYALGQDELAHSYIEKPIEFQAQASAYADIFEKEVALHAQERETLQRYIKNNPKRKAYVRLMSCFKEYNEIDTQGAILTATLEQTLADLMQCHDVGKHSSDAIHQAILSVGLTIQAIHQETQMLTVCQAILHQLHVLFAQDKQDIMATYLNCCLDLYSEKIKVLATPPLTAIPNERALQIAQSLLLQRQAELKSLQEKNRQLTHCKAQSQPKNQQIQAALQEKKLILDTKQNTIKEIEKKIAKQAETLKTLMAESELLTAIILPTEYAKQSDCTLTQLKMEKTALEQTHLLQQKRESLITDQNNLDKKHQATKQTLTLIEGELNQITASIPLLQAQKSALGPQYTLEQASLKTQRDTLHMTTQKIQLEHQHLCDIYQHTEQELTSQSTQSNATDAANIADNQRFYLNLAGFKNILTMLTQGLQHQGFISYDAPGPLYQPSVSILPPTPTAAPAPMRGREHATHFTPKHRKK